MLSFLTSEMERIPSPSGPKPCSIFADKSLLLSWFPKEKHQILAEPVDDAQNQTVRSEPWDWSRRWWPSPLVAGSSTQETLPETKKHGRENVAKAAAIAGTLRIEELERDTSNGARASCLLRCLRWRANKSYSFWRFVIWQRAPLKYSIYIKGFFVNLRRNFKIIYK